MQIKIHLLILVVTSLILVSSCSSQSGPNLDVATVIHTVINTQIVEVPVTVLVQVTQQIEVTRIVEKVVTPTSTSTPIHSPTPSHTPTITLTPTITPTTRNTPLPSSTPDMAATSTIEALGILASPKKDGIYTVGKDIIPGKWRSNGLSDNCYWERRDDNQEILDNHLGYAGGTVNIHPTDYEIQFKRCGTWVYVENEVQELLTTAAEPKDSGFYTVGVEIIPGLWKSNGTGEDCYWVRLDSFWCETRTAVH